VESQCGKCRITSCCSKDNDADSSNKLPGLKNGVFDRKWRLWVLTYAYALEQLLIFIPKLNAIRFNTNFTAEDKLGTYLYNHEVHREF
jgi:hypothetical protein